MYTYNWISYGWGKSLNLNYVPFYSSQDNDEEKSLFLNFNNNFSSSEILDAGIAAIEKITKEYPEPYTLMLSGGVDSQTMFYIWLQSGKKFKTRTFLYNQVYNFHDISTLVSVSNKFRYKFEFENIDVFNFFQNELQTYALDYHCTSPQICLYMKMSTKINEGTVIFSGNLIDKSNAGLNYSILGMHRYSESNNKISNKKIIPFFLLSTPELAFSAFKNFDPKVDNYYLDKIRVLRESKIPIIPQSTKFSGFEEIKNYYDTFYPIPTKMKLRYFNYINNKSTRSFDIHLRYPLEQLMPYSNKVKVIGINNIY